MSDRSEYYARYRRERYQRDPEFVEKERARCRAYYERKKEERREAYNARRRARYVKRPRKVTPRPPKVVRELAAKPAKVTVPKRRVDPELRRLWSAADPNSIIRRKYKRLEDLPESLASGR